MQLAGIDTPDLLSTSVLVLNIGAERGYDCPDKQWLYIPDEQCEFFRVGFYSNVDPAFAPSGKASIYVERSFTGLIGTSYYADSVVAKLRKWGWIGEVDVIGLSYVDCAYTWMTKESARAEALEFLKGKGIESIGRYGKWKFQGIAQSIKDGMGQEA
jgi:protoporphyrinogen oxidase